MSEQTTALKLRIAELELRIVDLEADNDELRVKAEGFDALWHCVKRIDFVMRNGTKPEGAGDGEARE